MRNSAEENSPSESAAAIMRDDPQGIGTVLAHQSEKAAAAEKVSALQKIIGEQRLILDGTGEAHNEKAAFDKLREDLLAGVSVGSTSESELTILAKEIEANQADWRGAETEAERAGRTITGLERMLSQAEQELAEIESATPAVLAAYLRMEAEAAGAAYVEAAKATEAGYLKILALSDLIFWNCTDKKGRRPFTTSYSFSLDLPRFFDLAAFEGTSWTGSPGSMFDSNFARRSGQEEEAIQREKERLESLGVIF